jgi:hypothetical protein
MSCRPMYHWRSDSSRHCLRTGHAAQTASAAAASRRAKSILALTGYHWSGSRLLSAHRALRVTNTHSSRSGMTLPWAGAKENTLIPCHHFSWERVAAGQNLALAATRAGIACQVLGVAEFCWAAALARVNVSSARPQPPSTTSSTRTIV